ncbi:hypothetical protein SCLARK_00690 [Spiroplasma clarkii]|uniref:hypothetical protein n=1 Tax=Spiroplasma clarkii TaxID=2139 RepID=UPI000B55808B|nr:hypothetical protein [Spiroplasma clarkii]ARU91348.1 hypothetical protein SCLARK_00690 [Spiroplasma clarkii]
MSNFEIFSPCDLKILSTTIHKVTNKTILKIVFTPLNEKFQIPLDGVVSVIKPFNYYYEISNKKIMSQST